VVADVHVSPAEQLAIAVHALHTRGVVALHAPLSN
jgi:hypothetical protein